jgi:hypothetical protein
VNEPLDRAATDEATDVSLEDLRPSPGHPGDRHPLRPAFRPGLDRPLVPVARRGLWDRLGLWTVAAVILIAIAYAYPLLHLLSQQRFGSPGVAPF